MGARRTRIVGILLAAGAATRFGGGKLLAQLADGTALGVRSAQNLIAVLPDMIAVVRPGDDALASALRSAGARVSVCADAGSGMGASLAHGVREAGDADGYVVALADMPWISADTIRRVALALADGARLAVPRHAGERGHPVGFGSGCRDELLALSGDTGAKPLLAAGQGVRWIDVDDAAIVADVDVPGDLTPRG